MDTDTVFRVLLEIENQGPHSLDLIDLIKEEFNNSTELELGHKKTLLHLLRKYEVAESDKQGPISSAMSEILKQYPSFQEECAHFMKKRLLDEPDDRRID
ncbi:MAG: hypothetical protein KKI15_02460 [Proteobacteria bacterium]|nr:hypothetical protein [Pseudomonadota bacterium]